MTTILPIHHLGHQAGLNRTERGGPSLFSPGGKGPVRSNGRIIMMPRALMGELISSGMGRVNPNQHLFEKSVSHGKEGLVSLAIR